MNDLEKARKEVTRAIDSGELYGRAPWGTIRTLLVYVELLEKRLENIREFNELGDGS